MIVWLFTVQTYRLFSDFFLFFAYLSLLIYVLRALAIELSGKAS